MGDSSCGAGNKGNWIALYVFGGLKIATGLVLVIVGIILMAHQPAECAKVKKCYEDKGIPECFSKEHLAPDDRRLSEVNLTHPLDSDYSPSILPRVSHLASDVLGLNPKALNAGPLLLAGKTAAKDHQLVSTRRLNSECYSMDEEDCDKSMQTISDEAGKWGTALLVIGLVGALSGGMNLLAGKQKVKVWLGLAMAIDIVMMILCIAMFMIMGFASGIMKAVCDHIHEEAAANDKACWEDLIGDVCSFADLFGTATIMFLIMFFVELGSSISDCTTCCCCVPEDATWNPKHQASAAGAPAVIGTPVGAPAEAKDP